MTDAPGTRAIAMREHERLAIGERWSATARQVHEPFVAGLERLQRGLRPEPFILGRHWLSATQWIGTVSVRGKTLDVLPKCETLDIPATRSRVMDMLAWAGLVPALPAGRAWLAGRSASLLEVFMALYVTQLSEEWRRGPLRSYEPVIANRAALRGKLLIAPHLRTNVLRPAHFLTQADVFAEDGPTTRTLKAALSLAQRTSANHHTLRLAGQLLADFKDVGLRRSPTCAPGLGRGQQRFESLLALAELLLSSTAPQGAGAANTYSLLFDMNVVFERYIAALLRREVCPPAFVATAQAPRLALLRRGGQPVFRLRPDVAIERDGRLVGLLDTKWKELEPGRSHHGVAQADIYQAYAYAREHDCACVVLLYPGAGGLVDTYHLNPAAGPPARICVATVDLAKPHRLVARQLQDVLQQASIMPTHGAG